MGYFMGNFLLLTWPVFEQAVNDIRKKYEVEKQEIISLEKEKQKWEGTASGDSNNAKKNHRQQLNYVQEERIESEERQGTLIQLQWKVIGDKLHEEQEINSKKNGKFQPWDKKHACSRKTTGRGKGRGMQQSHDNEGYLLEFGHEFILVFDAVNRTRFALPSCCTVTNVSLAKKAGKANYGMNISNHSRKDPSKLKNAVTRKVKSPRTSVEGRNGGGHNQPCNIVLRFELLDHEILSAVFPITSFGRQTVWPSFSALGSRILLWDTGRSTRVPMMADLMTLGSFASLKFTAVKLVKEPGLLKQKEDEKLWQGLESKFPAAKIFYVQLTLLQVLAGQIENSEKDRQVTEEKLFANSEAVDKLTDQVNHTSLKLWLSDETIRGYVLIKCLEADGVASTKLEMDANLHSGNIEFANKLAASLQEKQNLGGWLSKRKSLKLSMLDDSARTGKSILKTKMQSSKHY
ncbi:hypothetical protein Ancab_038453 [Ancistrocladus abbreviatus]